MKVKIIKQHPNYPLGVQDISDERANYLLRVGVAEKVEIGTLTEKVETKIPKKDEKQPAKEKKEMKPAKEKVKKTK